MQECSAPTQTIRLHIIDYKSTESIITPHSAEKNNAKPQISIYSLTRLKGNVAYRLENNADGSYYLVFDISGTDELEIKVGEFQADTLKIETKYATQGCCGNLSLVKVQVNGSPITPPANNVIVIRK